MMRQLMFAATLLGAAACASGQSVVFVRASASSTGTGASWATAYVDLQSALTFAAAHPGTQIWVAEGTYYPGQGSTARSATFLVPSGTILIGGFAGWERTLDQRSPALHRTILSGDILRDDHLGASNAWNNAWSVVTVSGAAQATFMQDLTITRGYGREGAGVRIFQSQLSLTDCEIADNQGELYGPAVNRGGAGIAIGGASSVVLKRCRLLRNAAASASPFFGIDMGGDGGAVRCESSFLELDSCFIAENEAGAGGYVDCFGGSARAGNPGGNGGAICLLNNAAATATNSVFESNRSGIGGSTYCCEYGCATTIGGAGAAIHIGAGCTLNLLHCTLAGNPVQDDSNDAVITGFNQSCSVVSSIIWDDATQLSRHISPWVPGRVQFSCIRGLDSNPDSAGNFGSDPLLAGGPMRHEPVDGMSDARLLPGSPCIDAASAPIAVGIAVDGIGMVRALDNLDAPNRGAGSAEIPDIGAIESSTAVVDSDGDGISDLAEIAGGDSPDCNHDGLPDAPSLQAAAPLRLTNGSIPLGLGSAVSITGEWLFAGSPRTSDDAGTVMTFRRVTTGWVPASVHSGAQPGGAFGTAVAVAGNWAMVGAPAASWQGRPAMSGAVWIYRLVDGQWQEWQVITAPDAQESQRFGAAVAIAGDRAAAGAPGDSDRGVRAGAVYVMEYSEPAASWTVTRKFTSSGSSAGAGLGSAVAVASTPFGAVVVAGGPGHEGGRGSGLILRRRTAAWVVEGTLAGVRAGDRFGASVAADDRRVCIGAPGFEFERGAAFVLSTTGSAWGVDSILRGETPGQNAGTAVSIAGPVVLIAGSGVAGVTKHVESAGDWWKVHSRVGPAGFGATIATDGPWVAVGAPVGLGAVYAFASDVSDCDADGIPDSCELAADPALDQDDNGVLDACQPCPVCIADFDRNGGIDGSDIEPFFTAWSDSIVCADVNQDGGVDGADLEAFFRRWEAGSCN